MLQKSNLHSSNEENSQNKRVDLYDNSTSSATLWLA